MQAFGSSDGKAVLRTERVVYAGEPAIVAGDTLFLHKL